jgi:uncharacterized protein
MSIEIQDIILASLAALMAGFVDAVVGGGGLVQVPALFILFPNFMVPQIIGSNRFASFMGTSVAAYQYAQKVEIPWKTVFLAGIGAALAAYFGALFSSMIKEEVLKPIVLVLMTCIAIYSFMKKELGTTENLKFSEQKSLLFCVLIGSFCGFYNGFVGPGTGSLLVFGFVSIVGFGFLRGSAVSKFINVIADVASLVFFVFNGFVIYKIALPMMLCNMAGSFLGSKMAILRGNTFVRKFFLFVISLLILRFSYDVFFK